MTQPTILLTGFEPFGDHAINPSALVAEALAGATFAGAVVRAAILPVDAARVGPLLHGLLEETRPVVALALGLAAGRAALHVERVAVNVRDFAIADNAGAQATGDPICAAGPDAYLATVPVRALVTAIRAAGVPACLSNTAGTYLCNQALYTLMHLVAGWAAPRPRCGFIHLPCLPAQAAQHARSFGDEGWPSMSLATMCDGVRAALHATLEGVMIS